MPRIIRYFPVSHDINSDPEMWELRGKFGEKSLSVWLEILSIADRNEGKLGANSPQLHRVIGSKLGLYSPKVRAILEWCLGKGWLQLDGDLYVTNYRKYHRTREPNPPPPGVQSSPPPKHPSETSEPSEDPDPKKAEAGPVDNSKKPDSKKVESGLTKDVIEAGTRIYEIDRVKFRRLVLWMQKNKSYPPEVLLGTFKRFEPYAKQIDDYWPYLDKLLTKSYAEFQQGGSKREGDKDLAFLKTVVKGMEH